MSKLSKDPIKYQNILNLQKMVAEMVKRGMPSVTTIKIYEDK